LEVPIVRQELNQQKSNNINKMKRITHSIKILGLYIGSALAVSAACYTAANPSPACPSPIFVNGTQCVTANLRRDVQNVTNPNSSGLSSYRYDGWWPVCIYSCKDGSNYSGFQNVVPSGAVCWGGSGGSGGSSPN